MGANCGGEKEQEYQNIDMFDMDSNLGFDEVGIHSNF